MISSVHIRNFLSYTDVTIPLGPLTVIIGENLSGKTNILRALQWCLLNTGTWSEDPYRDSIRRQLDDGSLADEVSVTVEFSDGLSIERRRSSPDNAGLYVVHRQDGSSFEIGGKGSSIGRGFCPDIGALTGIKPVAWPDKTVSYPQFSNDAVEGRFLLGDGANSVDVKLGSILGLNTLESAVKLASTRSISEGKKTKDAETRVQGLEQSLAQFEGLDEALEVDKLGGDMLAKAEQASANHHHAIQRTKALSELTAVTQHGPAVSTGLDQLAKARGLTGKASQARSTHARVDGLNVTTARLCALRGDADVLTIAMPLAVSKQATERARITREAARAASKQAIILTGLPRPLVAPERLSDALSDGRAAQNQAASLRASYASARVLYGRMWNLSASAQEAGVQVTQLEQDAANLKASVAICPIDSAWRCTNLDGGKL